MGFEHHRGPLSNLPNAEGPGAYYSYEKVTDGVPGWSLKYATTDQVDDALELIDDFGDDPWFVWLAFSAAHLPLHPPPSDLHSQQLNGPQLPGGARGNQLAGLGASPASSGPPGSGGTGTPMPGGAPPPPHGGSIGIGDGPLPTKAPHATTYVKAMLEAVDSELGRLLDSLPPAVRADTLIVVVGDNGTEGEAIEPPWDPTRGKGTMFEAGLRVPFIVSGPGVARGGVSDALVHTTDLFATISGAVGANGAVGIDSVDMAAALADPASPGPRQWVYTERFRPNGVGPYEVRDRAVRDTRFKLVRREINGIWVDDLLFEVVVDPDEALDLADPTPVGAQAQAAFAKLSALISLTD